MVGDRHHDIHAAHDCFLDSVGVLWGYGDREEHERAHATHMTETVEELQNILLS